MAEYLSPGVYVEELDNSPRSMEGVGTSTAGFVGMAVKGPTVGAPVFITSFAEYQRTYGGFLSEYTHGEYRYLAYAVEQFFANGGTRCFVARVIPEDAKCAEGNMGVLTLKAINEGSWGNRITVSVKSSGKKKMQLMKKISDTEYTAKSTAGFYEGDAVKAGEEKNRIVGILENKVTFEEPFKAEVVDDALVPQILLYSMEFDISIRSESELEQYEGVNLWVTSPNYVAKRLSSSKLVEVANADEFNDFDPIEGLLEGGEEKGSIELEGGSDGTLGAINDGTFIGEPGGPGKRTGIEAFLENNVVSIMAVPGVTSPDVMIKLIGHCENMKNRFAVLDMPKKLVKTDELLEYRSMVDSTYAAMYHPWIKVFDRSTQKPGFIPPSGAVIGVYAKTDMNRGVHKAPANETVLCTGLSVQYNNGEQDMLNPQGVNLIRSFQGQGIRIWGARTASSNAAFKYVNVRRLFIYVEESIKVNTNWVVFEPNDANLWARVRITISSFLENLWRAGMLTGSSAGEAYFVEIGPSTMSQDDIRSGRLICNVGIAPSRPAEFVIFRVSQFTQEAGGE